MQKVTQNLKKRYIRGDTETGHKKAAQESDIPSRIIKKSQIYSVSTCYLILIMQ